MNKVVENREQNFCMAYYLIDTIIPRPVIVICPGGGYMWRSPRESGPVAKAFNEAGFHAVVLEYNVEEAPLGDRPLKELSWAVHLLREQAEDLLIHPEQIVVCGFSAGGHLAGSLGVFWNDQERFPEEAVRNNHKPNAMILSYPVITAGEFAHRRSFERLTTESKLQQKYSLEKFVTKDTPPCFIWHTISDPSVPVQNTLLFVEQLVNHKVPVEVMLFPKGEHGLSLATKEVSDEDNGRYPDLHVATWFPQCVDWLRMLWK